MNKDILSISCENIKEKDNIRFLLKVQTAEKRLSMSKYLLSILKKN